MRPPNALVRSSSLDGWAGKIMMAALVATAIVTFADPVLACTVCSGGQEEASRKAFVGTTALLTFLPMVVAGSAIWFFVRRTLAQERQDAEVQIEAGTADTGNVA
jgi:hypothetical protein